MDFLNLEGVDLWRLLAGLGIFLFGMFLLEEGIHTLSGRAFQRLLQKFTNRPVKAVLTGTLTTAVLQSSSAVSLMVLAFVGAGVLAMNNAIGVVIGSNLGTTFTAWIVASVGFKVDIEAFALPFIGLGGLGLIFFGKRPRYASVSKLLTGFGFLFMGLEFMKVAVVEFTDTVDASFFEGIHLILYVFIGFLLTVITQSSSASMAIILSMVYSGAAGIEAAAMFVIGANVGTTVTVMLGTIGGSVIKKQVAASHVIFNWVTALVALLALPLLLMLVDVILYNSDDPVTELAMFHTIFNLMGVLLFLPFTNVLGKWVVRLFPDKSQQETLFISNIPAKVGHAAAEALRKESWHLIHQVLMYHNKVLGMEHKPFSPLKQLQEADFSVKSPHLYEKLKTISDLMHKFAEELQEESIGEESSSKVNHALFSARMALFSAKWMRDLKKDISDYEKQYPDGGTLREELKRRQELMYAKLSSCLADSSLHEIPYEQIKDILKREDRRFIESATKSQNGNALKLAQLLTINKTWYLSWRNLMLALRELDIHAEADEEL
ncbi:MAG: Na/Pi cotransporter family protein [Flavobacteriales bacterium]